jgi:hypothetical protein
MDKIVTDWRRNKELLLENSEPFVRALFAENKDQGEVIAAIGYVFEFGRGQLCFELCANTARNAKKSLVEHLAQWPNASADSFRWNSGDYDYPGAIQDRFGGWSEVWWNELSRLDRLAYQEHSTLVHEGVADICCEVIAELAKRGVIGDWSIIDFNVSALLDEVEQVKKRDQRIRYLIRSGA